jgi:membrane-associated phospholipid phosphatase
LSAPAFRCRITCLASAGVFLALALLVSGVGLLPGERGLYETALGWTSSTGIAFFKAVNYLGRWQVLLPGTLLLIWLAPAEARRQWWLWVAAMVLTVVLESAAKEIIGRPRPRGQALGFPSGDVTAAATYFSLVAYLMGQRLKEKAFVLWTAAWALVALVGLARVVRGAHWPADVLGGAALGLALASAAFWWHERQARRSPARRDSETGGESPTRGTG